MTRYGPHRPEDAPNGVVILGGESWPQPQVAVMPAALLRQRQLLNDLAAGVGGAPPSVVRSSRPLPVQARASTERGRARLVECAILARRGRQVPLMWGTP